MRTRSKLAIIGLLTAAAAAPGLAQELSGSGEALIVSTPPSETVLPDGRTHVELSNRQVLLSVDPAHPFDHAAITCVGSCMLQSGEKAGPCSGGCVGHDRDGDTVTLAWTGQNEGGWTLTGGSGKWSMASGSGTWRSTDPLGAGFSRNIWKGKIRMK